MIRGPDLTIALTVANMSLMRTQITSSRRYMIQNDFKLIKYSLKYNKNSKKKKFHTCLCGTLWENLKLYQLLGSVYINCYVR
jgi:hypothetical protein